MISNWGERVLFDAAGIQWYCQWPYLIYFFSYSLTEVYVHKCEFHCDFHGFVFFLSAPFHSPGFHCVWETCWSSSLLPYSREINGHTLTPWLPQTGSAWKVLLHSACWNLAIGNDDKVIKGDVFFLIAHCKCHWMNQKQSSREGLHLWGLSCCSCNCTN